MTWHYQIRNLRDTGAVYYDIVDVFEGDGEAPLMTVSIAPIANTPEELITVLEMMLTDAKKYPVLHGQEEPS
jgi:hypothetical protein